MKVRINLSEDGEPELTLALGMSDVLEAVKNSIGFNASSISPFLSGVFDNIRKMMKDQERGEPEKPYKKRGKK